MIITANTQELANYNKAADGILTLIDDLGFTTDKTFDPNELRGMIVGTIIANTHISEIIDVEAEEQEPTEDDLDEILAQLEEEEQGNFYNTCPHCGQLVR